MLENNFQRRKILDIGCGDVKLSKANEDFPGYSFEGDVTGLDFMETKIADVVCDLNKGKLPFKDNTFDIVYAHHVLEHIKNLLTLLPEIFRVLKKGGRFLIRTPHLSSAPNLSNLTHVVMFGYKTLDPFLLSENLNPIERNSQIEGGRFRLIKKKIIFGRIYRHLGLEYLANKHPDFYEGFLTFILPAREMHFELEK